MVPHPRFNLRLHGAFAVRGTQWALEEVFRLRAPPHMTCHLVTRHLWRRDLSEILRNTSGGCRGWVRWWHWGWLHWGRAFPWCAVTHVQLQLCSKGREDWASWCNQPSLCFLSLRVLTLWGGPISLLQHISHSCIISIATRNPSMTLRVCSSAVLLVSEINSLA